MTETGLEPTTKWLNVRLRTKWLWVRVRCSHLNFRYHTCFEQWVLWHSDNYIVWIHSKTRGWHDTNIQAIESIICKLIKNYETKIEKMKLLINNKIGVYYQQNTWTKTTSVTTQPKFTCSKLTIGTLQQSVKCIQR